MIDAKTALPEGYKPGLEGVIAGVSEISEVDSAQDALTYRGYAAHELAEKATYEEVSYLLIFGKLPTKAELSTYQSELSALRPLSPAALQFLKQLPKNTNGMNALRMAVSFDHTEDPDGDKTDIESNQRKAKRLVAKSPTIIAALTRLNKGQEPVTPNPKLGHAANFLYMISGQEQDAEIAKIFDSTNTLYGEHGYNASTFSALVTASTLSDMHSTIASAIGTLKGPLHGGANEAAIAMLLSLNGKDVDTWLKDALARKEKIMGFGHRVYKGQDSRAPYMKQMAERMAKKSGNLALFELSCRLEDAVKREKNLFPNVDYHCAVAYYLMGLPIEIYTPIFAMARMSGWTAHVIEQHAANRLIRPKSFYLGSRGVPFVPIEKRN